jgi:hypothetical protein
MDVSPERVTLTLGQSFQLSAVLRTSSGTPLPATITWSTGDQKVATVSATGVVQAAGVGGTTIAATAAGLEESAEVTVAATSPVPAGFFVSPIGRRDAPGTDTAPWDLATALAQPDAVTPGSVIWLRNGTYQGCFDSRLTGSADRPIIVRQYPQERAIIDGSGCEDAPLTAFGAYTWYWGFEVANSTPRSGGGNNVNGFGDNLKFINLVVHDAANSGLGLWSQGEGGELYGSLIFNNGTKDNLDHGLYMQNLRGTKLIRDNIIFNQWGFGIHAYGSSAASLRGFQVEGNVLFNNGSISPDGKAPNILIGGSSPASDVELRDNVTFTSLSDGTNVRLGWEASNTNVGLHGNLFVGGAPVLYVRDWAAADVRGNVLAGDGTLVNLLGRTSGQFWGSNRYHRDPTSEGWIFNERLMPFPQWQAATGLGADDHADAAPPSEAQVFVRPNRYETGRANIIVQNWPDAATVSVDLSGVLHPGQRYEVRNAQTYFAPPVTSGTYDGAPLLLSMAAVSATPPQGRNYRRPPNTGPRFNVFVLLPLP